MKNSLEGLKIRFELAKAIISKHKEISRDYSLEQKEKVRKNEQHLRDPWDTTLLISTCPVGVPGGEEETDNERSHRQRTSRGITS